MELKDAIEILDVDINNYERMQYRREAWQTVRAALLVPCRRCNGEGQGLITEGEYEQCQECNGTGEVLLRQ